MSDEIATEIAESVSENTAETNNITAGDFVASRLANLKEQSEAPPEQPESEEAQPEEEPVVETESEESETEAEAIAPEAEVEVQVLAAQGHRLQVRGRLGAAQLRALVGAALENGGGVV